MLDRLLLFRNIGKFDSVSPNTIPLAKLTLIYAENGRGKTTLAAVFRSLATGDPILITERKRLDAEQAPHVVVMSGGSPRPAVFENGSWNRTVPNMAIFDDTFVDDNICSGLVVESAHRQKLHELILGAQGVHLSGALQAISEQIETHNRNLRERTEAIPSSIRGGFSVDEFCGVSQRASIDSEIRDAERAVAAAQEQAAIRSTPEFAPLTLSPLDVPALSRLLTRQLSDLDRTAAAQVQTHIATLGEGGEAWVSSGARRIPGGIENPAGRPCPFCAQDLGAAVIVEHYRAYFGRAYAALKQEIVSTLNSFRLEHNTASFVEFERSVSVIQQRRQFWARFAEIPELDIALAEISNARSALRDAVISILEAKQTAPLELTEIPSAALAVIARYESAHQRIAEINGAVSRANHTVRLVKERAAAGNAELLRADLNRLVATKMRHTPEVASLCTAYVAERLAKAQAERARNNAREALDNYRQNVFPAYQVAVNNYLARFNAGFRLESVSSQNIRSGSACTYNVVINSRAIPISAAGTPPGEPSFRSSLSAGDRNTLALAFFFASMDQNPDLANSIAVIDDPISSLDEHRSLTTVQEIRRLAQRAAQVVVLSHSKPFLCNIWDQANHDQCAAIEIFRDGSGSGMRAWDVNRDMITEHDRQHLLLRAYAAAATPNGREVAQSLRPIIEHFLRVAYPEYFPPGTLLGPFRNLCGQRVDTSVPILSRTDVEELAHITEYANLFHHDTNPAWQSQHINDAQLFDFVQRVLAFTRRN